MRTHSLFMNKSGNKANLRHLRARITPILIALVLVCSLVGLNHTSAAAATGTTYYVNNTVTCNDTNAGTSPASPFCTIGRAAFLAGLGGAGDTVQVVAGTYAETVEPRFSGSSGSPITFTAGSGVTVTGDGTGTGSAFRIINPTFITINGFHIGPTAETGIYVSSVNANVIVSNNTISGTASHGIYVLSADHVTVSNNTVTNAGGNAGIYLKSVTASTVSGNTSYSNGADGIRLNASTGVTVSNNTTYSNLTAKANGIALILASNSNTVLNNTVYANRDTGIQVDDSNSNIVVGNLSYHNGDHGLDITSSSGIAGSPNTVVVGNTFQGNYTAGINVETNSTGATIVNNIVADNGQMPAAGNPYNIHVDASSVTGTTMDYNLYWMTSPYVHQVFWNLTGYDSLSTFQTSGAGQEAHGVQVNPLFVSPAAPVTSVPPSVATGDYHLSAGSPAIDSANSGAPNEQLTDIQGSPRVDDPATTNTGAGTRAFDDRGAYEYQVGGVVAPTLTTQAVTNIGTTTATGNGTVTSLGIPNPTQHGVVWGTSANPTIALTTKTSDGPVSATGAFTSNITGLAPGTQYHVRAYATNSAGTSYGGDVSFTSLKVPTVTTQAVTNIGTTTATGNGNVTNLGVPNPTQHGVVWDTSANPTIVLATKTSDGPVSAIGAFTSAITGLTAGTLYHVRAYATNDAGTSYGTDVTFSIAAASTTSVNCGAGTAVVTYGLGINCVATVTRSAGSSTPSGSVSWTTGGTGTFTTSPCTLVAGAGGSATCSVTYSPTSVGSGSHLITATYAGDANFTTSNGNQSVTVNTAAVTPVITAYSKVYDGNLTATILTRNLTGIIGTDAVTLTGGTATFDTKAVGPGKTVTGTGFTLGGAQVANYHLASASATTTANIAAKPITINGLTADNKVYDRLLTATLSGTAAPVGVVSGDTVTVVGPYSANFATKTVANGKPVTVSGYTLGGADAGNYSVSQPTGLTANITPLGLTVSGVVANDKVYNGNNTATFTTSGYSFNTVIPLDVVTLDSSLASGTSANKNVGTGKPVTALGFALSGADGGNYTLTQPTGLTASISQFGLTATATADDKFFDNTTAATVHLSTNKFGSDVVTTAFTDASFGDVNAGVGKTVSITGITISGADALNYNLLNGSASTTATINPAPVTVTAISRSKHITQAISFAGTEFTMAPTTLFGTDTLTNVHLTSTGADAGAGEGDYPIVAGNPVVGSGLSNYALTFVDGNLHVSATNDAPSITEGATKAVSMSVNGKPTAFSLTLHATDADLDTITWGISTPASHGAASASGTGGSKAIHYTPAHNYAGADQFTVQVSDAFGGSDTILVKVTVARPVLTLKSNAVADGWVLESGENTNVGGVINAAATSFNLGDDATRRQYRAILSFNTKLPSTAVITSVTLKIKQLGAPVGANPFLTLGNILVDIQKGNFGTAALQAADFQAAASKNAGLTFINHPVSGWYSRALVAANFAFINKAGNTQFRLRFTNDDNNNRIADYLRFYSGNASASSQPVLIIQYYVP